MSPRKSPEIPPAVVSTSDPRISPALAVAAGIGWFWAFTLLATRYYPVLLQTVLSTSPPVWGFMALPGWKLMGALAAAAALSGSAGYVAGQSGRCGLRPIYWLLPAYAIPLLDVGRAAGILAPFTWYEPLLLAALTGQAVWETAKRWPSAQRSEGTPRALLWFATTCVAAVLALAWWYHQGCSAYDNYLLGYHDCGHFAYRVANTWHGRGFLLESPGAPAFWDHFNPGLALLAPLWGLWPDAKLFILLQAACLALPALTVFAIARAWDARPAAATAWAVAYLAFPALGQLNLNYSYGWHPVSLALPFLFLAVWLLMLRRYVPAAVAALLACSFKETVLVTLGCLAAVLALQAWRNRPGKAPQDHLQPPEAALASRLPWLGWLLVWALITLAFFLIVRLTPFAQFQTARFANLGDSSFEIALSPILRPHAFWRQMIRQESVLFVLALLAPLGVQTLRRGWLILLAAGLPMTVLLAWEHSPATCIAFQYVTTLIPVFFLAAMSGAANEACAPDASADELAKASRRGLMSAGIAAMAACLTASALLGGMPWSSRTLLIMKGMSYQVGDQLNEMNPRAVGTLGHRHLTEIVDKLNREDYAVLASGRVAAHLLNVRRLEAVGQAVVRWNNLCREAGQGRSGVEAFDWIVLDTYENFQQSSEDLQFIADEARRCGYRQIPAGDGILVFARLELP